MDCRDKPNGQDGIENFVLWFNSAERELWDPILDGRAIIQFSQPHFEDAFFRRLCLWY